MHEGSACVPITLSWLWPIPARWQLTHSRAYTHVHTHQRVSTLWPGRGHCSCPGSLAGSSLIPVGHHVGRTRVSVTPAFPSPASPFVSPQNVATVFRLPGPVVPVVSTGALTALGPKMQRPGWGGCKLGWAGSPSCPLGHPPVAWGLDKDLQAFVGSGFLGVSARRV